MSRRRQYLPAVPNTGSYLSPHDDGHVQTYPAPPPAGTADPQPDARTQAALDHLPSRRRRKPRHAGPSPLV